MKLTDLDLGMIMNDLYYETKFITINLIAVKLF